MTKLFKNLNSIDDGMLWDQLIGGDNDAYSYIYKKYVAELFSYGMRFTADRDLIKDCIQDVFVRIYNNRSNLNSTNNVKLYLFIALKNMLFNVFEKDKSFQNIDTIEPVFSVEYTIEDEIIHDEQIQEQHEKIERILSVLTPRQKEVIYYRYVEGLSISDICSIMEMNYQSVLNLIQRSMKRLHATFVGKPQNILKIKRG
ncbi:MAG: sigma-70 family RNA polymerase sigma factor [Tannerella sp.]|nr:sigma-70 family RNA polymerase sigma factor [Tannerella sp.]